MLLKEVTRETFSNTENTQCTTSLRLPKPSSGRRHGLLPEVPRPPQVPPATAGTPGEVGASGESRSQINPAFCGQEADDGACRWTNTQAPARHRPNSLSGRGGMLKPDAQHGVSRKKSERPLQPLAEVGEEGGEQGQAPALQTRRYSVPSTAFHLRWYHRGMKPDFSSDWRERSHTSRESRC